MSDPSFASILHFEIQKQRDLIERFRDHETAPHLMSEIRQERLELLERLLTFERSDPHQDNP